MKMVLLLFTTITALSAKEIRIGAKRFTEGNVISYVIAHTLKDIDPSLDVKVLEDLGGTGIVTTATENQEIDFYVDYTGTLKESFKATNENLAQALMEKNLILGFKLGFNNSFSLAVKKSSPLKTIQDIKDHHRLGVSHPFYKRKDGFKGLSNHYQMNITPKVIDYALLQYSLLEDKLDAIEIYKTDAKVIKYDLRVLEDSLNYYKRYDAVIVFNKNFFDKNSPLIKKLKKRLENKISDSAIRELNYLVDVEGDEYEESARFFTKSTTRIKSEYQNTVWPYLFEHIEYLFLTVILCMFIGIPLGILTAKSLSAQRIVLSIISMTQTIPSLALLVFLIPLFGLGKVTTLIALCMYGLLPIVKNTHTGITKIPRELIEYSKIIGMSTSQRIFQVEIPLAIVDIISGVKLTAIYTIGITVIAAFIGAGGLGTLIVTGLSLNDTELILKGAIPSAALAIFVEVIFQKTLPLFMKNKGIS